MRAGRALRGPIWGSTLRQDAMQKTRNVMEKMMKALRLMATALILVGHAAFADEAGDLVFAERGPWQPEANQYIWRLDVAGPTRPGFMPISDGRVEIVAVTDEGKPALELYEKAEALDRKIGPFPVDGTDPALIFFLETTSREMAKLTGGSPFYIQNRMKDALFRGGQVQQTDKGQLAIFRPFEDDPNKDKMAGFEGLEITFTIQEPNMPIPSMIAATPGEAPGFRVSMVRQ